MTLNWNPIRLSKATPNRSYGGKGESLVKLAKSKHPEFVIPKTFLFNLNEIDQWISRNCPHYKAAINEMRWGISPSLEKFRRELVSLPFPSHFTEWSERIYKQLGNDLIVRSSMNVEDHETSSFSGCFESIRVSKSNGPIFLWNALLKVLASAFTETSIHRVLETGALIRDFKSGLFIQEWIQGDFAGVCFSRSPLNPWDANGCIEWAKQRRGADTVTQGSHMSQVTWKHSPPPEALKGIWDGLWRSTEKIEDAEKRPVDVEWVSKKEKLFLVQARVVATAEARLVGRTRPGARWSRELTLERFPQVLTPLGWSALRDAMGTNLDSLDRNFGITIRNASDIATNLGGRIYSDPDLFQFPSGVYIRFSHFFAPWKKTFWQVMACVLNWLSRLVMQFPLSFRIPQLEIGQILLRSTAERVAKNWNTHRDACMHKLNVFRHGLHQKNRMDRFSAEQIMDSMHRIRQMSMVFLEEDLSIFLIKDTTFKALKRLWTATSSPQQEFYQLFNSFDGNRTLQMNADLEHLVALLQKDSGSERFLETLDRVSNFEQSKDAANHLMADTIRAWESFVTKNGHCRSSWDIGIPSWGENPSQLAPLLRSMLAANPDSFLSSGLNHESNQRRRLAVQTEFFKKLKKMGFAKSIPMVQKAMNTLETFIKIDEEQHFLSGQYLETSRQLVLRAEKILIQNGVLRDEGSIFFLHISEMKEQLSHASVCLQTLADRRKSEWIRNKNTPRPMELPPQQVRNSGSPQITNRTQGQPMSPGRVTGPTHVLEHISDAKEIPVGAVLVTTSPNPSFAPIYSLLGGMITSTGGPLSHGFISAREYGLPAVSNIENAPELFPNGTWVEIDGTTGTIQKALSPLEASK